MAGEPLGRLIKAAITAINQITEAIRSASFSALVRTASCQVVLKAACFEFERSAYAKEYFSIAEIRQVGV